MKGSDPKSAWGEPLEPSIEPSEEPLKEGDQAFELFWNVFGLKNGKAQAVKAWRKAIKDTDPSVIIQGASAYRDWLDKHSDPPTQKWAQGWLNDRRWEDELPTPQQRGNQTYGQRKQAASVALLDAYRDDPRNNQPKGIER